MVPSRWDALNFLIYSLNGVSIRVVDSMQNNPVVRIPDLTVWSASLGIERNLLLALVL